MLKRAQRGGGGGLSTVARLGHAACRTSLSQVVHHAEAALDVKELAAHVPARDRLARLHRPLIVRPRLRIAVRIHCKRGVLEPKMIKLCWLFAG